MDNNSPQCGRCGQKIPGKRADLIAEALEALQMIYRATNAAFSLTNWGQDNGCKQMLIRVREAEPEIAAYLKAAAALDREDPK